MRKFDLVETQYQYGPYFITKKGGKWYWGPRQNENTYWYTTAQGAMDAIDLHELDLEHQNATEQGQYDIRDIDAKRKQEARAEEIANRMGATFVSQWKAPEPMHGAAEYYGHYLERVVASLEKYINERMH